MADWPYYTARWQRNRRQKLQRNPLCEFCLEEGRIEPATEVDHKIPINQGGDPFPRLDDLTSLCAPHHNAKSRAEQLGGNYVRKGCDIAGRPLDPHHPWNRR